MSVARAPNMILPKFRLKKPGLCPPLAAGAAAPAAASPAAAVWGGVVAAVLVLPLVPLVLRPRWMGWLAVPSGGRRRAPRRSRVVVEVVVERPRLDLGWVWVLLCGRVAGASPHRRPLLPMCVAVGTHGLQVQPTDLPVLERQQRPPEGGQPRRLGPQHANGPVSGRIDGAEGETPRNFGRHDCKSDVGIVGGSPSPFVLMVSDGWD